jgi:uncharacterized tellurite resistance protein B-like protein
MNLFNLAQKQLHNEVRQGKRKDFDLIEMLDYAIVIRKHLDYQERGQRIAEAKRLKGLRKNEK